MSKLLLAMLSITILILWVSQINIDKQCLSATDIEYCKISILKGY